MNDRVQVIKQQIENNTYDWDYAIETVAEKIILLNDLNLF